jgi:4-amino-4-deoxy-L-arabinose transferase-like glycosyltransferase
MTFSKVADNLWGSRARFSYLLIASIILLFTLLDARDIWTQEHRWADIVSGMFYRHDFLHPYLEGNNYYDKPLLSYWFIAFIASLRGQLTVWALRLPSALAGLLAIWSVYRLGSILKNKSLGLLSGWLLITTFYFVFWARTSSADMLNLAGSLFAVTWYFEKREKSNFFDYFVFFLIIAVTSLCKGLVGAIVPLLAVAIDMILQKSLKRHLRLPMLLGLVPALFIYFLPFWASSHYGAEAYGESGLYLVYRENILRYFQPFDHQGPVYTYLLYLPIYLLPWAIFFIPALTSLPSRWSKLSSSSQWLSWTLAILFLFFTVSGSRRSYYILPMVPFAILFTADWLLSGVATSKSLLGLAAMVILIFILLLTTLDILPAWYYSQVGARQFAVALKKEAIKVKPWNTWNVVMLNAESKVSFYLNLPPAIHNYPIKGSNDKQSVASLVKSWPIIKNKPSNTIFITRRLYVPLLQSYFSGYRLVELSPSSFLPFGKKQDVDIPIAFIPLS